MTEKAELLVGVSQKEALEFVKNEYDHVSKYTSVIYDTRDRFFGNYMTVAIGLFGFLAFLLQQQKPVESSGMDHVDLPTLSIFALLILVVFGIGTQFLLWGNGLARDYYRQRRKRMQQLLLINTSEDELRQGIEEYLSFSRDKTNWAFRITSIYVIYCSSISVANSLAVLLALAMAGQKLSPRMSWLSFITLFLVQHLMGYVYVKLYTRGTYPEG